MKNNSENRRDTSSRKKKLKVKKEKEII